MKCPRLGAIILPDSPAQVQLAGKKACRSRLRDGTRINDGRSARSGSAHAGPTGTRSVTYACAGLRRQRYARLAAQAIDAEIVASAASAAADGSGTDEPNRDPAKVIELVTLDRSKAVALGELAAASNGILKSPADRYDRNESVSDLLLDVEAAGPVVAPIPEA